MFLFIFQILNLAHNKSDIERKVHASIDKFAERGLRSLAVAYQVLFSSVLLMYPTSPTVMESEQLFLVNTMFLKP